MRPPPPTAGRRRVVKKIQGHGHHGGAWKIAYADFVTAMMALFMVLWLLASTDAKARKEISNYFRSGIMPDSITTMTGGAQVVPVVIQMAPKPPTDAEMVQTVRDLKQSIRDVAADHHELAEIAARVRVVATEEGTLIEIVDEDGGDSLLFDSSSARLKPALAEFLTVLAPVLADRVETLEILGHTDARPFAAGATKSNWELSFERAAAARKLLEAGGVEPTRVVGVIGRGSATPLDRTRPYAATNRRLSVLLRRHAPTATADPAP